jgi:hypothetical protein
MHHHLLRLSPPTTLENGRGLTSSYHNADAAGVSVFVLDRSYLIE